MRPAGKARRPRISGIFEGGATQPEPGSPTRQPRWGGEGMQRRPNAVGLSPRAAKGLRYESRRSFWNQLTRRRSRYATCTSVVRAVRRDTLVVSPSNHEHLGGSSFDKLRTSDVQKVKGVNMRHALALCARCA